MLHYILMIWFWSHGHVVRMDIPTKNYEQCEFFGQDLNEQQPTTWVCIPEGK